MAKQRETYEKELGKIMHKVSLHQKVVAEEQKVLGTLQQEANDIDEELSKLDGG